MSPFLLWDQSARNTYSLSITANHHLIPAVWKHVRSVAWFPVLAKITVTWELFSCVCSWSPSNTYWKKMWRVAGMGQRGESSHQSIKHFFWNNFWKDLEISWHALLGIRGELHVCQGQLSSILPARHYLMVLSVIQKVILVSQTVALSSLFNGILYILYPNYWW